MLLPISESRRRCLYGILWSVTLFTKSSRCAAGAVASSTSEVLVIGTPARHDLTTRTVTINIAYKPTLAPGDSSYGLLGCYGQTGIDQRGGHPFGTEQDYATPSSVDAANLTVGSCLDACATVPRQPNNKEPFAFAGLKNGSECYCFLKLDKGAAKLPENNCTTACPGNPKLSCGGRDALVVYSLAAASKVVKSTASTTGTAHHASHTDPVKKPASHSLSPSSPPPSSPSSEVKAGGAAADDNGGQPSSGTPKATAVAAISGSMSGAIILSVIIFFTLRAYKQRRREQDAHVAGMLTKSTSNSGSCLGGLPPACSAALAARSPSRGRTRTRTFRPPRLTGLPIPGLDGEGRRKHARAAFLATIRGQISAPLPPTLSTTNLPPACAHGDEGEDGGHSSAVQWRPAGRAAAAAAAYLVPASPWGDVAPASPAATAQPAYSLGDRAWHRRRLSTPYAPPTIPLPPTPPIVREKKLAAAAAAAGQVQTRPGPPGPSNLTTPLRPGRKETAATFETGSPVGVPSGERGENAPEQLQHLEYLPSTTYLGDREPTIPVLPPIIPGGRMDFDSRGWKADEASPTMTVGTDILYSPGTPRGGGVEGKGKYGGR